MNRLLALLLLLPTAAVAGPWVRPLGSGFAKVGVTHFRSSNGVNFGVSTGLAYRSTAVDTYVEAGLGRGFQVVASLPYVAAYNQASGDVRWRHQWAGDLRLELDTRLHKSKPFALGVEMRVPTYRDPADYVAAKGMTAQMLEATASNFPQLGDTNLDITVKGMAGASFKRGWVTGELGPRFRTEGFASGVFGASSVGLWAVPEHLGVNLYTNANLNLWGGSAAVASRELWYVEGSVFATGLEALPGAGLQLGVGGIPVARNSARGVSFIGSATMTW